MSHKKFTIQIYYLKYRSIYFNELNKRNIIILFSIREKDKENLVKLPWKILKI